MLMGFKPFETTKENLYTLYLVIGVIASVSFYGFMKCYIWLDKVDRKHEDGPSKKKRVMTSWGGPLVMFLVLFTFAQQWKAEPGSFTFAVSFKDSNGAAVSIQEGEVVMLTENGEESRDIDQRGRAVFKNIPHSYLGKEFTFRLEAKGWRLVKGENIPLTLNPVEEVLEVARVSVSQ
jgi:hypothetical protein